MPGCSLEREANGTTARYRICGRFEGACAWELAGRIEKETSPELTLDFSQCAEFVDYGVAVLANALLSIPEKVVHLEGLRQHHLRLFKYFGVEVHRIEHRPPPPLETLEDFELPSEVA